MVALSGTVNGKPWRLARSLVTLLGQINRRWPNRPTHADGTIGDAAHQARVSDHNPNSHGVVTALDITAGDHGHPASDLARSIQQRRPRRIKYVIWDRRIMDGYGGTAPWQWRPYDGPSPHTDHIHISVSANPRLYDLRWRWGLACFRQPR